MKKTLLFLLLTLTGLSVMASPVKPQKALLVAKNFMAQYVKGADQMEATVVYTHPMPKSGQPAMYAVNIGNMFVLVSADDIAHPVLGYSLSRPWPVINDERGMMNDEQPSVSKHSSFNTHHSTLPPQVASYLDDLATQIEAASAEFSTLNSQFSIEETSAEWQQLLSLNSHLLTTTNLTDSVGPLLTTTWSQGQYYNVLCPEDATSPYNGHVPTGCVATAMAQIINYWGYPIHGRGTHSYQSNYGTLSVNYDSASYDYAHMPTVLTATSTPQEVNAVATLMRDCGVAANMGYGPNESGAYDYDARAGFINFFRLSPNINYAVKCHFADTNWQMMLIQDLEMGRPILYCGDSYEGGHAFVCDGYKQGGFFHFNFGWNGYSDGWYLTSAVNSFNSNQTALIGIIPDSTGNVILGQMSGTSTFVLNEPIELYHLMGHNSYTGVHYSNNCDNTIMFYCYDTAERIFVDKLFYCNQYFDFYNGYGMNEWIGNQNTLVHSINTTNNAITIHYSGFPNDAGFGLYLRKNSDCPAPTNIIIDRDTSSAHITWYSDTIPQQWQIEYGPQGFVLGNGTSIYSNDSEITINNLSRYMTYDIYLRSICDSGVFSSWIKRQVYIDPYWTDIVKVQPEGYVEDSLGNAYIYSAEGLAWFSAKVNGLNGQQQQTYLGKTVYLMSDIDLSAYRWNPIGKHYSYGQIFIWDGRTTFWGTFDGNNHVISNIYVNDTNSGLGLFGIIQPFNQYMYYYGKTTIKNIIMDGGTVMSSWSTEPDDELNGTCTSIGGVLGCAANDVDIINCHSSVEVFGNMDVGSLVGSINNITDNTMSIIQNCSATGDVHGSRGCGGLIGEVRGNVTIQNCFATGNVLQYGAGNSWYRGGLIGNFMHAHAYNCYSSGHVEFTPQSNFVGIVIGGPYINTHIHNIYGYYDSTSSNMPLTGNFCDDYQDNSGFYIENGNCLLSTPISINGTMFSSLVDVMNGWVLNFNEPTLKTWIIDTLTRYPIFGDYYEPSCYNPTDLSVINATLIGDTVIQTELSWTQIGEPNHWEVLYVASEHTIDSGVIVSVNSNPCILTGIPVGQPLDFYVRAICNSGDESGWSNKVSYLPDKLRWTEVVTSHPEGYIEDAEGNVYISSAEGLAWLSSVANGLNGVPFSSNRFMNKNIILTEDIDISEYRWTPIGKDVSHCLQGATINGNNHTITGLYCNELEDFQGLIGFMVNGAVKNIILKQVNVQGKNYVGSLIGYASSADGIDQLSILNSVTITNCAAEGAVLGIENVGGITGRHYGSMNDESGTVMANSFFRGSVLVRDDITRTNSIGGYAGGICGSFTKCSLKNCYVVAEIDSNANYTGILTGSGGFPDSIANCYFKDFSTSLPITSSNSDTANISSFTGSGCVWNLNAPPTINGSSYSNLVDALNAWVDANNTDGQYSHWAADTAMFNGGYPVFAVIPCTPAIGNDSITVCDSYTWHGITYTADAVLIDTLSTLDGCDSIVTHYLTVNHRNSANETATACESYFFGGQWLYASGQYTDTLTNIAGCDSIATLYLTINNPVHTATTVTACDSYTWNGATITTSGDYTYPHNDDNGCTQVDTLHLTINYSTASSETATACEAYFWNGEWQYSSGQYSDTLTNAAGCDSIVTLTLTINNPVHTATTVTACDSYTWQEAVITTSGTYHYTHTDAHSCTQDDTLYLTINHNDTVIVDEEVCDSITWYGTTYTASAYGIQYLTVPNTVGCDSIFLLDLTVNYTTYGEMSAVSCDSYQWDWNSAIYTTSGDYTYRDTVNQNSQFCDSVLTLHLTINHSATADTTATACDLFVWYGNMGYDVSGDYEHQWWNVTTDGCDSILTLHLTINYSTETTVTDTAEGSYSWHGTTYTESGTYTWNGTTAEGCDSTVTLLLTITPTQAITQSSIQAIKIYPNPTSDLLTIDADDILSVELFDLNGRLVFSSEVDNLPFTFRLSPFTLNAGSYLLRIHTRQGTAVQHVILN